VTLIPQTEPLFHGDFGVSETIDGETIEIACPTCDATTIKTVAWLKTHTKVSCRCGTVIPLTPRTFNHEIAKVNQAVDRLRRSIGK
jgi:hypothetical protein